MAEHLICIQIGYFERIASPLLDAQPFLRDQDIEVNEQLVNIKSSVRGHLVILIVVLRCFEMKEPSSFQHTFTKYNKRSSG